MFGGIIRKDRSESIYTSRNTGDNILEILGNKFNIYGLASIHDLSDSSKKKKNKILNKLEKLSVL